jgi:hypothetical protein
MKCLGFRLTGKPSQAQIFDVRAFMTESSLGEARRDVATQRHRSHARHAARETERFARGLPANNALLWGRGMKKSTHFASSHQKQDQENDQDDADKRILRPRSGRGRVGRS